MIIVKGIRINMPNKLKAEMICFLFAFLLSSCSSLAENPIIGGSCTYKRTWNGDAVRFLTVAIGL